MRRVEKRPQVGDRNGFHPGLAQYAGCHAHLVFHQGGDDLPLGVDALGHRQGQRPFDQDRWRRQFQVVALPGLHAPAQGPAGRGSPGW